MRIGRRRFKDVVERQLELFERENAGLVRDCEAALRAYDQAAAEQAEELYGDFLGLVESGRDELNSLRDTFARSLDPDTVEEYLDVFNGLVRKRLPRFALEIQS